MSAQNDSSESSRSTESLEGEASVDNEEKLRGSNELRGLSHALARQEALLQIICDKLPSIQIAEEELKLLRSIKRRIPSESTKTQFWGNISLQVTGIIFVLLLVSLPSYPTLSAEAQMGRVWKQINWPFLLCVYPATQ
jgi:hypothetical protein